MLRFSLHKILNAEQNGNFTFMFVKYAGYNIPMNIYELQMCFLRSDLTTFHSFVRSFYKKDKSRNRKTKTNYIVTTDRGEKNLHPCEGEKPCHLVKMNNSIEHMVCVCVAERLINLCAFNRVCVCILLDEFMDLCECEIDLMKQFFSPLSDIISYFETKIPN